MGTSRSAAQLSATLVAAGTAVARANRKAVTESAIVYKDSVLDQAKVAAGQDMRLSRWGRRGVKLGAGFDVKGEANATATLKARPQGPWKVVEYGSAAHDIVPGRKRGSRGKALRLPDGSFVRSVRHPGARPKRSWSVGVTRGTRGAIAAYRRVQVTELATVFK